MNDYIWPFAALLGIIAIALLGGTTKMNLLGVPATSSNSSAAYQLQQAQEQANNLSNQVSHLNDSPYANDVSVSWGSFSGTNDPNQEYIVINTAYGDKNAVDISGWKLVSTSTNQTVTIPTEPMLYFANTNLGDGSDVILSPGEKAYIITGRSPLGYGFRANICSGYLTQGSTFTPYLYTYCPLARNEDLSSIPRTPVNNNCFDLIDSLSSCQNPGALNPTYSYECQQFVSHLNYTDCVKGHKSDSDFYSPGVWYVYLKRDSTLWQSRRETVIVRDKSGKTVATLTR